MSERLAPRDCLALIDLMILVAAAAISLGVFRMVTPVLDWESPWPNILAPPAGGWTPISALIRLLEIQVPFLPVAVSWTIAVPILRFRRKNRRWRRLARQPGTAACLAALLGWGWVTSGAGLMFGYNRGTSIAPVAQPWMWLRIYFSSMLGPIGTAVALAWIFLAVVGLWRPVPDALDRIGRIVGFYWVLVGFQWSNIFAFYYLL